MIMFIKFPKTSGLCSEATDQIHFRDDTHN
jgi:hypothetical protein